MESSKSILLISVVSYISYFLVSWGYKLKHFHNLSAVIDKHKSILILSLKYFAGILLLGLPGLFLSGDYQFLLFNKPNFQNENVLTIWIVLLFSVLLISSISAKKNSSQNGTKTNSLPLFKRIFYLFIRVLFLLAYEFYFRGVLLFALIPLLGLVSAIAVNTFLYSFQHIFDAKKELLGSVPFGIIVCVLSFYTQSIWPTFILHASLAGVYEGSFLFNYTSKSSRS